MDDLEKVPSIREFLEAAKNEKECYQAADTVGMPNDKFTVDESGGLVRTSQLDGAVQSYLPGNLCSRVLYECLYSTLTVRPGERKLYDTMRRNFLLATHFN